MEHFSDYFVKIQNYALKILLRLLELPFLDHRGYSLTKTHVIYQFWRIFWINRITMGWILAMVSSTSEWLKDAAFFMPAPRLAT